MSDLERGRAFYERWFKTTAGVKYSSAKRDFTSYFLSLGSGARLELMISPGEVARLAHLAVSVRSRNVVDHLVKAMEAAGVHIVSGPRLTGGRILRSLGNRYGRQSHRDHLLALATSEPSDKKMR